MKVYEVLVHKAQAPEFPHPRPFIERKHMLEAPAGALGRGKVGALALNRRNDSVEAVAPGFREDTVLVEALQVIAMNREQL